jgi:hypothetical protein
MNPLYFKLAHLIGLMALFIGIGGMIAILHGVGLLLLLLAGFGYLGVAKMGTPAWAWVKTALWLALGAFPILAKRRILSDSALVILALLLGTLLAWQGIFKSIL